MAKDKPKKTKNKADQKDKKKGVSKAVDSVKGKKEKVKKPKLKKAKKKQRFYRKLSFWIIFSWGFAAVLIAAVFIWQNIAYAEKNFLGMKIDNINVTGKTKEETKELLAKEIAEYSETKVTLKYQDQAFKPALKDFGLNTYESKLWTALLSRGISTAGELSDIAGVPRSRSYDVLESLEKKGFILMKVGKPIKYVAVPPSEVLERVKKQIEDEASK